MHQLKGEYVLSSWGNLQTQLYAALCLGGEPPKDWSEFLKSQKPGLDTEMWEQPVFDTAKAWSDKLESKPDRETFLDLIRKMVTTQPSDRSQIAMLHSHRYFSNGSDSE
jgi:serine/threonine protein kinase